MTHSCYDIIYKKEVYDNDNYVEVRYEIHEGSYNQVEVVEVYAPVKISHMEIQFQRELLIGSGIIHFDYYKVNNPDIVAVLRNLTGIATNLPLIEGL